MPAIAAAARIGQRTSRAVHSASGPSGSRVTSVGTTTSAISAMTTTQISVSVSTRVTAVLARKPARVPLAIDDVQARIIALTPLRALQSASSSENSEAGRARPVSAAPPRELRVDGIVDLGGRNGRMAARLRGDVGRMAKKP